eukprot:353395-Rhodomonas_salina.3
MSGPDSAHGVRTLLGAFAHRVRRSIWGAVAHEVRRTLLGAIAHGVHRSIWGAVTLLWGSASSPGSSIPLSQQGRYA